MDSRHIVKKITFLFSLVFLFLEPVFSKTIRIPSIEITEYLKYLDLELEDINDYNRRFTGLLGVIAEKNDWNYEYIDTNLKIANRLFEEGSVDFLWDQIKNPEKENNGLYYSIFPSSTFYLELVALKSNSKYNMANINELKNTNIGYLAQNVSNKQIIKTFFDEMGISVHLIPYNSKSNLSKDLEAGILEAGMIPVQSLPSNLKVLYNFGKVPTYYASKDKSIIDDIDNALELLFYEDPEKMYLLYNGPSKQDGATVENISEEDANIINLMSTYRFVMNCVLGADEVVESKQAFLNQITGISGIKFNMELNYGAKPIYKNNCVYEVVALPKQNNSDNLTYFSDTAYKLNVRVIAAPDIEISQITDKDNAGNMQKPVIAISSDLINILPYIRDIFVSFDPVIVTNLDDAVQNLSNHKYDALVIEEHYLIYKYKLSDYHNLRYSENELISIPICFAVYGAFSEVAVKAINKALAQLGDDLYDSYLAQNSLDLNIALSKEKRNKNILRVIIPLMLLSIVYVFLLIILRNIKLKKQSYIDELTLIRNIKGFEKDGIKMMEFSPWSTYLVAEINIKGFSYINRLYGSDMGNLLLCKIANELNEYASRHESCIVAHGYADNFYLMQKLAFEANIKLDELSNLLLDIQEDILKQKGIRITLKSGSSLSEGFTNADSAIKDIISKAGYARRYNDKSLVQNVSLFTGLIKEQKYREEKIESSIDKALLEGEFYVVYQPKISLDTQKIYGAEALVRWNSSENGVIPPDQFIPILEHNGYASKLDFYVYKKVFEYMKELEKDGLPLLPISLNISRLNYNPSAFVSEFDNLFKQYNLPKECIEMEIEERFVGADEEILKEMVYILRTSGYRVSMDDFGSGQSSLNMLSEIPVDIVKIDQKFLRQASTSKDAKIILSSTINMLKQMGKHTICEGVESEEQVNFLKSIRCDVAQGYYYSRPLDSSSFKKYLVQHI